MSPEPAYLRTVRPILELLIRGKEDEVLSLEPDAALNERIEVLASKCTEGELTPEERKEYEGYVRTNHLVTLIWRLARSMKAASP